MLGAQKKRKGDHHGTLAPHNAKGALSSPSPFASTRGSSCSAPCLQLLLPSLSSLSIPSYQGTAPACAQTPAFSRHTPDP